VSFNLVDFYHNESRLLGADSLKLSFEETGDILRRLASGFEAGDFPPPQVETYPLEQGPALYRDLNESKIRGKPVLVPDAAPTHSHPAFFLRFLCLFAAIPVLS